MMKHLVISFFCMSLGLVYSQSNDQNEKLSGQNLTRVADSISQLMSKFHFNPLELKSNEYLRLYKAIHELAKSPKTKKEFTDGFNTLWANGPFSHVSLQISHMKAADMAEYFDNMRVGEQAVSLEWIDQTAVLTVNTMMGVDTYEHIVEAYQQMANKQPNALIIDVRYNTGGAFAIVPLVGHVLSDPLDVGMFVSNTWWKKNSKAPNKVAIQGVTPWQGWSLRAFWNDVQEQGLIRVKFNPIDPVFKGPVYVLISGTSASATEFAVDALANLDQVTLIGETTAGKMLSQKMFDLPYGLQLSLPIAEYYSTRVGRIEGKGIQPDITIDSNLAKQLALLLINGAEPEEALKKVGSETHKNNG